MITVGTATIIMPANVMANARYTVALSIILRSNTVSSLPLITLNTVASKTTNVVVLIPPPVEAEDAPINIKSMVNTCVILLSPPMFTPAAIPGLTLGCFLANLASPFGPVDWIFGSVATLLAAVVSYLLRNVRIKDIPFLVPMAPVLFNALVVGVELACFSDVGFGFQNFSWVAFGYNALTVGAGELVICYALGLPFAVFLLKTSLAKKIFLMRN